MKSAKMSAIILGVAAAGMASMSVARGDEAQARSLLKVMSDYPHFSFRRGEPLCLWLLACRDLAAMSLGV
jgi:hypothetical protein